MSCMKAHTFVYLEFKSQDVKVQPVLKHIGGRGSSHDIAVKSMFIPNCMQASAVFTETYFLHAFFFGGGGAIPMHN